MAINFNKLFLQNLLPKAQSTAHAQVTSLGNAETDFDDTGNLEYQSDYYDGDTADQQQQQECQTERLAQTLESLRQIIDSHNRRRGTLSPGAQLAPSRLSSIMETPKSNFVNGHRSHRRTTTVHQPYQVDAAPVCKAITGQKPPWMNERLSKKSEQVSGSRITVHFAAS